MHFTDIEEKAAEKLNEYSKRIKIIFAFVLTIILVIIAFKFGFYEPVKNLNELDDQRSTIWPVLISLAVTLLGSLITTYVFLKSALDRTVDEKPYYRAIIKEYREKTMKYLWYHTVYSLTLMALVVFFYFMIYFLDKRSSDWIRGFIVVLYGGCMLSSSVFLQKCIDINKGMQNTAERMLSAKHV